MDHSHRPLARTEGLVVQEMPDQLLVYDVRSDRAHCLNGTAASVWKACDGSRSVAQIATSLPSGAGSPQEEGVVWLALEQLQENDLMETSLDLVASGFSRRDLVRKVGLAAAVALPVVASLAAPKSALAVPSSCTCVNPGDCITQTSCPSTVNCNPHALCAP